MRMPAKNYLDVGNVEIGAAVGVYFGAKSRRRVRIPTANKSLFMTVVIDTSLQDNRMAFRVFDPFGTEFAIVALQGTEPGQLAKRRKRAIHH
jgi:hypothetical protein